MRKTLHRSTENRMIAGVCGGIAEYFGIDPTLVRLGCAALAVISFGTAAVAYVVAAVIIPEGRRNAAREPIPAEEAAKAAE